MEKISLSVSEIAYIRFRKSLYSFPKITKEKNPRLLREKFLSLNRPFPV